MGVVAHGHYTQLQRGNEQKVDQLHLGQEDYLDMTMINTVDPLWSQAARNENLTIQLTPSAAV